MQPLSDGLERPVLYSFRRCPYAMRARLAIRVSGVAVVLREVVLRDKPAALRAVSAKATVPVLVLPDGRVLEQSLDIMCWALAAHDPQGWRAPGEEDRCQWWVDRNDGDFKQALDRYKYANRHPERPADAWRDEAVAAMLAPMETQLAQRRFLLRDTPSLADMAILPFVRQFAGVDAPWFDDAPLPHLRAWMRGLVETPLFDSVMGRFDAWQPGADEIVF